MALTKREWITGGIIVVALATAGYLMVDTWLANQRLREELAARSFPATAAEETPENRQAAEGTDETAPSGSALASYTVAADVPRALYIDSLDIAARVLPMSVNPDGSMQAPIGIYDTGWYMGSARPGDKGAVAIDGHASGPTREGLFAYLDTLSVGDEVRLERGDGEMFRYRVVHSETIDVSRVDMTKFLTPHGSAEEGLNLITCNGQWLRHERTFNQRTIVYPERV